MFYPTSLLFLIYHFPSATYLLIKPLPEQTSHSKPLNNVITWPLYANHISFKGNYHIGSNGPGNVTSNFTNLQIENDEVGV